MFDKRQNIKIMFNMKAIEKAIDILGGDRATAAKFGFTAMAVRQWRARGVPLEHCFTLEELTGGLVTCHDLRPDKFPKAAA